MTTPTQTQPPFMPLRHVRLGHQAHPAVGLRLPRRRGRRRVPRLPVAQAVPVAAGQRPRRRTSRDVKAGIGSCAAGLHDSENAYGQVLGGDTAHAKTARVHLHLRRDQLHPGGQPGAHRLRRLPGDRVAGLAATWTPLTTTSSPGRSTPRPCSRTCSPCCGAATPAARATRAGHARDRAREARRAASRHRRDLDRREEATGATARDPQPARLTARPDSRLRGSPGLTRHILLVTAGMTGSGAGKIRKVMPH